MNSKTNQIQSPKKIGKKRVIPSRYKAAAVEAVVKSRLMNQSGSRNSSSSLSASTTNLNQTCIGISDKNGKKFPSLENLRIQNRGQFRLKDYAKLHSTAVNNTTLLDNSNVQDNIFSSTVLSAHVPKKFDCMPLSGSLHPICDFPDLSVITADKANYIPKNGVKELDIACLAEPSQKDVDLSYMEYLLWANIDANAAHAYDAQVNELKSQIEFLSAAVEAKERNIIEGEETLKLMKWYKTATELGELLKQHLNELLEVLPATCNDVASLASNLQNKVNEIKMENIFIPDKQEDYREMLNQSLIECCALVTGLSSQMSSTTQEMQSMTNTAHELIKQIECFPKLQSQLCNLSAMAIQHGSMQLAAKQLNELQIGEDK